ncbi:MAG: hypothetical protein QG588_862 [Candidatus Poribacteria bacterium]|nr:hypothetical protein [Candidatus Poribacteria bacterium]
MQQNERNSFSKDNWTLIKVVDLDIIRDFDCGDPDLNEYFQHDAAIHRKELLTETYCLKESTENFPIALISLCNDAVKSDFPILKEWIELHLNRKKHYSSYPAVKIARFGVGKPFQRKNIGSYAINMIKELFITDNRTGCRFITIDAYNTSPVLNFYKKNEFQFLSGKDKQKRTRSMFFDLKRLTI